MNLRQIGTFQFENLIRNRIPFVIVTLNVDIHGLFPPFLQSQADRQTLNASPEDVFAKLAERDLPKDQALVIVCETGVQSEIISGQLESEGYLNVYFLAGGTKLLREELAPK